MQVWIALLTCMTVKAVHLEITAELSAGAFVLVLRKFCAKKNAPQYIITDNAKYFVLCAKMLKDKFKKDFKITLSNNTFVKYLADHGTQ